MSYKVLDVCKYVIDYSNEKEYGISNLKLQKILYFIQAYFLIKQPSRCCFDDKIEAWFQKHIENTNNLAVVIYRQL